MWIVRFALDRPYTFIAFAVLILLPGVFSIQKTPTDIFPKIDIPVVTIVWNYNGPSTQEMAKRITTFGESVLAAVNDIRSIESQMLNGVATIEVHFHPQVRIDAARKRGHKMSFEDRVIQADVLVRRIAELIPEYLPGMDTGAAEPTDRRTCWDKTLRSLLTAMGKEQGVTVEIDAPAHGDEQLSPYWKRRDIILLAAFTGWASVIHWNADCNARNLSRPDRSSCCTPVAEGSNRCWNRFKQPCFGTQTTSPGSSICL